MEVICIWYDGEAGEVGLCDDEDRKTLKALASNEVGNGLQNFRPQASIFSSFNPNLNGKETSHKNPFYIRRNFGANWD